MKASTTILKSITECANSITKGKSSVIAGCQLRIWLICSASCIRTGIFRKYIGMYESLSIDFITTEELIMLFQFIALSEQELGN